MIVKGSQDVTKSATRIFAITPSDSADLAEPTRAIRCHGAGTLTVTLVEDDASHTGVQITVAADETLPLAVRRVWATGTAASSIVGFG